jgi:integrase/recombinase XerD
MSARPADRPAALAQLPGGPETDPFQRLAMAFLVSCTGATARAYLTDLRAWQQHCTDLQVHPFDARRHHVDVWIRRLTTIPLERTGRPMAPASIARRLSAVSAFYDYGIGTDLLDYSPVANVRRPKVSEDSSTVGLSADDAVRMLDAARTHSPRLAALVALLTYNGIRIDEALTADLAGYTYQRGHRILRITRNGGKTATIPLNPMTIDAIDTYLADRSHQTNGPLFLNRAGTGRLPYSTAFTLIRRLAARTGVAGADHITPHSFRHTFITEALTAGVPLQDVQDAAGHTDPRTTRRYDHQRHNLDRHPTYVLAGHLRRATTL